MPASNFVILKSLSIRRTFSSIPTKRYVRQTLPLSGKSDELVDQQSKVLKFYIETYGCQMNISDSEIVRSLLLSAGHSTCDNVENADLILVNTCAIRENAEQKIWHRLNYFQSIRRTNRKIIPGYPIVGVLGCMAERLKTRLLEEESVDFVCGPDAYRDITRLIHVATSTDQKEANVQLSLEETYADISPVREASGISAFVTIMRGCNNMCSYCIVPFTRGRERSRSITSIVDEVRRLAESGVREVVLLGQNVNSYHDVGDESVNQYPDSTYRAADGFGNMYRKRDGPGARFADLLDAVSAVDPELRVRFTSPHPKDFPDDVLHLVAERPNICSSLHLPAQSGSTSTLERMRRGYSRDVYEALVSRVRGIIPGVSISSDFISGFCGETEEEHLDTLTLLRNVRFDQAYMFAYSLRDKTHAARALVDDVPEDIKQRRLREVIDTFYEEVQRKNEAEEVGRLRLVLVEGEARKQGAAGPLLTGRTDENKRCLFNAKTTTELPSLADVIRKRNLLLKNENEATNHHSLLDNKDVSFDTAKAGDYMVVQIEEARGHTLRGVAVAKSSIAEFSRLVQSK